MDGNTRGQRIAVVLIAIVVVVSSVMITIFFSDSGVNPWRGGEDTGYQNVTFTDALLNCESETKDLYGSQIKHLVYDSHSSRYDERQFLYKLFFTLDLKKGGEDSRETSLIYINCYIKAQNGRLAKYEVFEQVEEVTTPTTKSEPSIFGWSN